jgi:uncharacterized protein (TIGR02186 family)
MKRLAIIGAACLSTAAAEPILVPDVSQRQIEIAYSFTGAELLLFGAILYPEGRVPARDADIVVTIKGPSTPIRLWEKQRILGIWANAESVRFQSAPGFYAVASSKPINKLVNERTAAIYELGLGNLQLSPSEALSASTAQRFEAGLIGLREKTRLFDARDNVVEISQGVLYRARISIPARVPTGRYVAETFLIRDGKVLAAATRDIVIQKSGFERFVARSAETSPFLYGLSAVLISVLFGLASVFFTRKR